MGRTNEGISRYLPHSTAATFVVAVMPVWAALWWGGGTLIASAGAMAGSMALTHLGAALWQHHPGSEDVVFGDLMLWSYLRRLRSKQTITRKAYRLGLDATHPGIVRTPEQQLKLLKRLAVSLEAGDPYTHGHSQRVARHAAMVAKAMRLPRKQREKIKLAGLLHDIGKLYVPIEVLNKPGRLTDEEFEIIKKHPTLGAEIVERLADPELTAMVKHHHERFDGTGYPDKRVATDIPLGARILSVADTFDALTSRRPYRPAQKHRIAIDILKKEAGTQLDREVVKAFLSYYSGRRAVSRWSVVTGSGTQAWQSVIGSFQRIGLAGVANATLAGTTAVALSATPLVSSRTYERDEVRSRQVTHTIDEGGGTTLTFGSTGRDTANARGSNGRPASVSSSRIRNEKPAKPAKGASTSATDKAKGKSGEKSKGKGSEDTADPTPSPEPTSTPGKSGSSNGNGTGKDKKATTTDPTASSGADNGKGKGPKKP